MGEAGDFGEGEVVEEAEEEEFAVARGEFLKDGVEEGFEFVGGCGRGGVGVHAGPFLFVAFAAGVDAAEVGAGVVGCFVEPAGDGGEWASGAAFYCAEEEEDGFGRRLRRGGVVAQEAARRAWG